jgi:DNA-directed RNA polymerase I, II, and III subunit RPABC2
MDDTNRDEQEPEEIEEPEQTDDEIEDDLSTENEDKQSNATIETDDEAIETDDEEIDENKLYDSDEASEKINVFDNAKTNYVKYDYEVEDIGDSASYKFNENYKMNHILSSHNECLHKNFNEIKELCKVTRDKDGVIVDEMHKTIPLLTKYEKTKILGMRVKQLNNGAQPYIPRNEKIIDNYVIALIELEQKKIPFIIQRPLPNNNFEYWKLHDLDIL